jgi:hypothetical protein
MHTTIPVPSRLPPSLPGLSDLPVGNTFGDLSNFLRDAIADEDSRVFSESMQHLALQAEGVVAGLRTSRESRHAAPLLMDLLTELREHRGMVVNLGLAWRGLYEYAAYLHALNNFRVLIGQWLLHIDPWDDEVNVGSEEFALVAWRTLGEGMLLVDMYEQWRQCENEDEPGSALGRLDAPQVERVPQWWQKFRR